MNEFKPSPQLRIREVGVTWINNDELLSAVMGHTIALALIERYQTLLNLYGASLDDLMETPGIGPANAALLKAAFELGRRLSTTSPDNVLQIRDSKDIAKLLQVEMGALEQEELRVVLLTTRSHVMSIETVYKGNLNSSIIRPAEIFREAIKRNAAAIVVIHNHPSGDSSPSPEDINITRILIETGRMLRIDVLDHIVIGRGKFTSLKEQGLSF